MGYGPEAPVPIFQHEAEFSKLLSLYAAEKPMSLLEVGTYHGGTLFHWLQNAPEGATITSLDLDHINERLYSEWIPPGVSLRVVTGDSHDPETVGRVGGPFDWVFIDADHYYDSVKMDWENYGPMATSLVAFHDILDNKKYHPEIEVQQLWNEIQSEGWRTDEIVENRNAIWGGIGLVWK